MVKVSVVPGSPLSVTLTAKVHDTPLFVQVPTNVAVLPTIANDVMSTLCTVAPVAWLTYCTSPLIGPVAV